MGKRQHNNPAPGFVTLRWAVGGLLVLGILSRFLGLFREVLVAGLFGTSATLDAIYLGLAVPIAFCLGFGGGAGRAVVPVAAALGDGPLGALMIQLRRRLLRITVPFAAGLGLLAPVWAPWLLPDGSAVPAGVLVIAAMLASLGVVGGSFAGLASGISNARARHLTANVMPFFHNGIIILCVLALAPWLGAYSLLAGVVLAEFGQVLALVPFLARLEHAAARVVPAGLVERAQALFLPALVMTTLSSLVGAVDRSFTAGLAEGSISALAYADRLLNLPVLLVGMAIQTPLYTRLSRFAAEGRTQAFDLTLLLGLRGLALVGMPIGVLTAGFAEPLIALLLQRGAFSPADTALAAEALRGYAVAIAFLSMLPLLAGAAMARRRAWALVAIYAAGLVANALLDALLVGPLGLLGITLATSAVAAGMALVTLGTVAPRVLRNRALWRTLAVSFAMLAVGAAGAWLVRAAVPPPTSGLTALAGYLAAAGGGVLLLMGGVMGMALRTEWGSLRSLRNRAARAAGLMPKDEVRS